MPVDSVQKVDGEAALFVDGELAAHPDWVERKALEVYNEAAGRAGWPTTQNLTESRRKRLRVALRDCGGLNGWRLAMDRAVKSDFLTGKVKTYRTPKGFLAKLDFFLRADRRTSLLDGEYDNAPVEQESFRKRIARAAAVPEKELPFVPEPRTERLRASIVSLRRYGHFERANRAEEKLAALENRAPVLSAGPDHPEPAIGTPEHDNAPPWDDGAVPE